MSKTPMAETHSTDYRGSLVLELPEPIEAADGRWIVAVWVNARRPDVTPARAVPMLVPTLSDWQASP